MYFNGCRMIAQGLCDQQLCSLVYAHTPSQEFVGDRASMRRVSTANTLTLYAGHITDQSVIPHNFTQLWFTFDAHPWPSTQCSRNRTKLRLQQMRENAEKPATDPICDEQCWCSPCPKRSPDILVQGMSDHLGLDLIVAFISGDCCSHFSCFFTHIYIKVPFLECWSVWNNDTIFSGGSFRECCIGKVEDIAEVMLQNAILFHDSIMSRARLSHILDAWLGKL